MLAGTGSAGLSYFATVLGKTASVECIFFFQKQPQRLWKGYWFPTPKLTPIEAYGNDNIDLEEQAI